MVASSLVCTIDGCSRPLRSSRPISEVRRGGKRLVTMATIALRRRALSSVREMTTAGCGSISGSLASQTSPRATLGDSGTPTPAPRFQAPLLDRLVVAEVLDARAQPGLAENLVFG